MAAINDSKHSHSLDHMFNSSFDKKYQMNAFELVAYDPINVDTDKALKRVTTNALGEYQMNDKTADDTVVYVGLEDAEGDWIVQKLDYTSGLSRRFATKKNNITTTSYSTAWTNRATLTYDTYGASLLTTSPSDSPSLSPSASTSSSPSPSLSPSASASPSGSPSGSPSSSTSPSWG